MSVKFGKVGNSLCWSNVLMFFLCIFGECRFGAEICNDITERIGRFKFDSPRFLDSQKLFREHYMLSVHSSSRIRGRGVPEYRGHAKE